MIVDCNATDTNNIITLNVIDVCICDLKVESEPNINLDEDDDEDEEGDLDLDLDFPLLLFFDNLEDMIDLFYILDYLYI